MKVTFIMPSVGRKKGVPYSRSWIMEPLGLAVLSALTPPEIERVLYDDRLEKIPYDEPTDLVAINVETYTANRAYQISGEYRKRGVPVVMGGYHPSLVPEEVSDHADAVVCGEGELIWGKVLEDYKAKKLQKIYKAPGRTGLAGLFADRSLFKGKNYFNLTLIETGRGCRFGCEFCSINAFYGQAYSVRPVDDVVKEIRDTGARNVFFVDDNIGSDRDRAKELFSALVPLRINWVSQVSMHICKDHELLDLMKRSGCRGVLIGFETLQPDNLNAMGKGVNRVAGGYDEVVKCFHSHQLAIYGTFVFGYNDTEEAFRKAYEFAKRNRLFYAAFNHLVPFPGTGLYSRLKSQDRLLYSSWWTDRRCRFGNIYFNPENMSPEELERLCYKYRFKFFSLPMMLYRLLNLRLYWRDLTSFLIFVGVNLFANRETESRRMLPFGVFDE
jgi:radical SAM superfamily enzyme YgiQ (UPF0313 family)